MRSPLHSRKFPTLGQVEAEVNATRDARSDAPPEQPQVQEGAQQPMSDADKFPTAFSYEAPPRDAQTTEQTAVPAPTTFMGAVSAVPWWVWLALLLGGTWAATKLLDDEDAGDEPDGDASENSDDEPDESEDDEDDEDDQDDQKPVASNRPRAKPRVTVKSRVKRTKRKTTAQRFDLPE